MRTRWLIVSVAATLASTHALAQSSNPSLTQAQREVLNVVNEGIKAGMRGDYAAEIRLVRPLAEQGYVSAQLVMAQLYMDGTGVPKDHVEATRWYQVAATGGNPMAAFLLAQRFLAGDGVAQSYPTARHWLEVASEGSIAAVTGIAEAQLGEMYYKGTGVAIDYGRAAALYEQSATYGNANGQMGLATCYFAGTGKQKDYSQAAALYHKAAQQGHASAQGMLGVMYWRGYNYPQDLKVAYQWTDVALTRSKDQVLRMRLTENLQQIAAAMSPTELEEVRRKSPIWRPPEVRK